MQETAADEVAVGQAVVGLQAALKGDVKTLSVFREVRPASRPPPPRVMLAMHPCTAPVSSTAFGGAL